MTTIPPTHCRAAAFEVFRAQLPDLETDVGLERAAIAIAMHELTDVVLDREEARLDALALRVQGDRPPLSPRATIAVLHEELFAGFGLTGNADSYYLPENSYLPWVLTNRRGIPISLTLLLKCVGRRLGVRVDGLNAPGHFLAAIREADGTTMILDPFHRGRILSTAEAADFISRILGRQMAYDPALLPVATHKQWVLRMLGNLKDVFVNQDRFDDARAMQELSGLLV
ncbi:MAG: transglutaminase-like domain-containing protein [Planctomycetota bacterium]|nr:transglutaminase-like domain-containing protein [Planctomycetota bacterium]